MNTLQVLRKQNKLSQKELAFKIGVSQQAVHKYETGEALPKIETLIKIASIFNVSIDSIIVNPEKNNHKNNYLLYVSDDEKEIIDTLRKINPDIKNYIMHSLSLTFKTL